MQRAVCLCWIESWVREQQRVEEVINKLEMIGDNKGSLYACRGSSKARQVQQT